MLAIATLDDYSGMALINIIVKDYGIGELSDTTDFYLTVYSNNAVNTEAIPYNFVLKQNYPNPFNPTTTFQFSLDRPGNTKLLIYNILGQKVKTVVDQHLNSGEYILKFNASEIPSGQYIYQLISNNRVLTKKMLILK